MAEIRRADDRGYADHGWLRSYHSLAFYCLAIILIRPKVYEALGIGIVAGILSMLISSSASPLPTW